MTGCWSRPMRPTSPRCPCAARRNEPSYVVHTAKVLGETIGVSDEEIADITTENFFRLFSKVAVAVRQDA